MIAVVVPTVKGREETFAGFMESWTRFFQQHKVQLVVVYDGENPRIEHEDFEDWCENVILDQTQIMGKYKKCLSNFNGGIRNLGLAYVAKYLPEADIVITLDDDTRPVGDTIQDHLDALSKKVPISWLSTAVDEYMRGFPYGIRDEAEVVLSHGVWDNVADWDAPTQLVLGSKRPVEFYRGPIPKGVYYPMCAMNIAFKRKLLPHMFQAPQVMKMGIGRADDIMCGILSKREIDAEGWAVVSGYSRVWHSRASNVFKNLKLEASTIELFEDVWKGVEEHPYYKIYRNKLEQWQEFIEEVGI